MDAPATPQPATKTFASFDKMLDDNELPVLVDFHAHWCVSAVDCSLLVSALLVHQNNKHHVFIYCHRCGPCQMMGHVVSTVSKRLDGAVTCVRIDCDKYPALASKYKVQALPTLVLFKDGKPIDKVEVSFCSPDVAGCKH